MRGSLFRPSALPVPLRSALGDIRFALIAVAGASFIVNLLMLVGPLFMLQVYDRVLPSRSLSTLIGLLLIAVLLLLVQAAVDALRSRLLARMGESFDQSIRGYVFACVQHQALKTPGTDGLQNIRDLDTLRGFMSGSGLIAACDLPWTPLYIIVCTLFHPLMGLAVAAGAIMLGVITWASETFGRRPTQALVGLAAARRSMAETVFNHAEVVHALGMSRRMGELWGARTDTFLDGQRVTSDLTGSFGSASRFLRMILQSGVLDAGLTDISAAVSRRYYEIQKFGTVAPYFSVISHVYVNPRWFNGLAPAHRTAIEAAARKAEQDQMQITEDTATAALVTLRERGMTIHEQTAAEAATWQAAMQPPVITAFNRLAPEGGPRAVELLRSIPSA
jgi:ABC-type multidrug transport system fused ATPase/permease subunit